MKDQHTYFDSNLSAEELVALDLEEQALRCVQCGLNEVASWSDQGPEAPALNPSILSRVRRKKEQEWMGYAYKIAAGFVVLILFFQVGKNQGIVTSDDPREATHFAVDSALNDTAFLLKEAPSKDTVKAVSFIEENQEMEGEPVNDLAGFSAHFVAYSQSELLLQESEIGLFREDLASESIRSRASPLNPIENQRNANRDMIFA